MNDYAFMIPGLAAAVAGSVLAIVKGHEAARTFIRYGRDPDGAGGYTRNRDRSLGEALLLQNQIQRNAGSRGVDDWYQTAGLAGLGVLIVLLGALSAGSSAMVPYL